MTFAPSFHPSDLLASSSPSVSREARRIDHVRTKIVRPADKDDSLDQIRPMLASMVRGEELAAGSKMVAYQNVGHAIGKSASWVRKLLGRHRVGLEYFEVLNIVRAYGALCDRIEAAAMAERRRAELQAEQLRRLVDARADGAPGVVAGPEGPDRH